MSYLDIVPDVGRQIDADELEATWLDMPWTKPLHSKNRVDLAGDIVSGRKLMVPEMDLDTAYDVAGNWRAAHGYPLHIMAVSLGNRAEKFEARPQLASRLKRMPSIVLKLSRFQHMQLSKMQDLGGCRAILTNVKRVEQLVSFYDKHPYRAAEFVKKFDYIRSDPGPKPDGYRSVHLIYKYQGEHQGGAFKGMRIEVQIRSRIQHAWATAVETIDTFTGQALKSNIGDEAWKRFFALMGSVAALEEKCPMIPGTPDSVDALAAELRELCHRLNLPNVLYGLSAGMRVFEESKRKARVYILTLDSERRNTSAIGFINQREAEERYVELEKANKNKPHIQTVLATSVSMRALRRTYPSYYLDTGRFIQLIEDFCGVVEDDAKKKEIEAAQ